MEDNKRIGIVSDSGKKLSEVIRELNILSVEVFRENYESDSYIESESKAILVKMSKEISVTTTIGVIKTLWNSVIVLWSFSLTKLFIKTGFGPIHLDFSTNGKNKYDLTIQSWIYTLSEENRAYLIDSYNSWLEGKTKTWNTLLKSKIFILRFILQDVLCPKVSYKVQSLIRPVHKPRL